MVTLNELKAIFDKVAESNNLIHIEDYGNKIAHQTRKEILSQLEETSGEMINSMGIALKPYCVNDEWRRQAVEAALRALVSHLNKEGK
jgi:hypothetical protein